MQGDRQLDVVSADILNPLPPLSSLSLNRAKTVR